MLGRLIDGRYQVRSRIARGGMATVYLATDLRLERRVAIKIMHGHLADDNTFKSRFVQEARSAARLAHPNVVNVFDQGQDADMAYLVMEYLPGITLRDLIKDYGRLTPEQTMDILVAVLSGLAAAHKAGIVHRDVKPENVLLADDGRIKLGDFGLARAASNNTATGQALLGTIAYLSPELVTRGVADARSDIYALGILTYEMLTGEQPYQGEAPMRIAYQHANDTVPVPSSKVPGIPATFDEVVAWTTARDPEDRPRDARVLLDYLQAGGAVVGPPEAGAPLAADPSMAATTVLTGTALAAGAGTVAAHAASTMVMPGRFDEIADADTQIFGSTPLVAEDDTPDEPGAELAEKAHKRKRRGYWLFAAIILLAAIAGGTGWYFGAGPGSQVAVPKLISLSPDDATAQLKELGLTVKLGTEYSGTIPAGLVASTLPGTGIRVDKGSAVTLNVSQGPQPITIPVLAGLSEDAARKAITDLKANVGSIDPQFNDSIPAGIVLAAGSEGDGADLSQGGPSFEGKTINLAVSLGAVPDVSGQSVEDATATLGDKNLKAEAGEEQYSESVQKGLVISAAPTTDGPVREGTTFSLTVSRGPEPVEVPDVIGKTWADAKSILENAGLKLDYNAFADTFPALVTVTTVTPGVGESVPRGSTVKVTFSL
ncbi:Stk1 family PASTA domain-containing Ser/Thr kinase [Leifsonia sp. YAF41]|uniref:Stk1 family PASTA domain-containing Ser/Thr kinase n=1 Tax=Leifsonia sp. YAF41 TaxID=3233086 RepID=UPI003F977984